MFQILNSRYLKIIAVVSMLVDHIGMILLPEQAWMRIIGRIAFPLFCFLIAFGATKTRSLWKYFLRLLVFAFISQVLISLAIWEIRLDKLNIFFTLSAGVLCIILFKRAINLIVRDQDKPFVVIHFLTSAFAIAFIMAVAQVFNFDYGMSGVLLMILFYIVFLTKKFAKYHQLILWGGAFISLALFNYLFINFYGYGIQLYSMTTIVFIALFCERHIKIPKWERWMFYVFYPLHLVVLYLI